MQQMLTIILLGAIGLFFGFANPVLHVPFMVLLYPAALYILFLESKHAFRDAWLCGLIGASASMYFIAITVHTYGYFPWALAIPCSLVMGAYIGLWGGVFVFILKKIKGLGPLTRALTAGLLWYLSELARSYVLTGFPWLSLSSAFAPMTEYIQGAAYLGSFALSGVFVGISVLLVESLGMFRSSKHNAHIMPLAYRFFLSYGGILLLLLIFLFGKYRLQESFDSDALLYGADTKNPYVAEETMLHEQNSHTARGGDKYFAYHTNPALIGQVRHVLIKPDMSENENSENATIRATERTIDNAVFFTAVQGNVSQAVKWSEEFQHATVKKYLRLSEESLEFLEEKGVLNNLSIPNILLFPETAMPFSFPYGEALSVMLWDFGQKHNLMFGAPGREDSPNGLSEDVLYYNRLFFMNNKALSFYDKRHLVPLGEYAPPLDFLPDYLQNMFANLMQGLGGFTKGEGEKLLVLRDAAYKEDQPLSSLICYEAIFPHLALDDVKNGARLFINISNDAWYDKTSAPAQHFHLSLMRAVEQKRFLVRAGNTGISAFVDDYGRIMGQTNLFEDASISAMVLLNSEKTVFFYLSDFLPYIACALLILLYIYGRIHLIIQKKNCD